MDDILRNFVLSPPAFLDPTRPVDRYATAETLPDRPGGVALTTESDKRLTGRLSFPAPGVARLQVTTSDEALDAAAARSATSPMLAPGLTDLAATVRSIEGGVAASGDGIELVWRPTAGGFHFGEAGESGETFTVTSGLSGSGPIIKDGGDISGWSHTIGIGADDAVFGGGESFQGPDLRGRIRRCVNAEVYGAAGLDLSYLTVPFFWSDAGWGVYAHTGAPMRADVGSSHASTLAIEFPGPALDLFFYVGEPGQILAAHHAVTGLPGRFPSWGLGVWSSRASYLSEVDVDAVLDGYEAADCPVDVVHVDYWQRGYMSELTTSWEIDRDRWPVGFGGRLRDRGVRLSLWHNPYLYRGTTIADDAEAAGVLLHDADNELVETTDLPNRLVTDFTAPAARQWWSSHLADLMNQEPVASLKCDFAEEVPSNAVCADGRSGWEIRNEYSLRYQVESHAALLAASDDDAVALFCRSGTAGAQRYPCHWVGDTPSTWTGMVAALRACLSLSLSGFAFVASDVGGFWTDVAYESVVAAYATMDPSHFTADVDPELFVRWTQWGALSPVMRFHGIGRREPWAYPEPWGQAAVEACRLRRRLRPYLESVAAHASEFGTPMMRPMVLAYPGDRAGRDAALQYLLGPSLLVAPILEPGGARRLWAPPGDWRHLGKGPDLHGPGWVDVRLALLDVPAWIDASAADTHLADLLN